MYTAAKSVVKEETIPQVVLGPVRTAVHLFAAAQTIPALTPVAKKTADNKLYPFDPAASDGREQALFVTVHDVDTTAGDASAPVYSDGELNIEVIRWPAALTTDEAKRMAFASQGLIFPTPV
ncbi:hypothetical protein NFHSH190041_36840 (plasmid) [Shewanella sp. NFH-SH190041]|uniref:head decoration protein n=1 Tax=Shewanella sp. NFH-SH190041 TaxID=2950245 RepID=UPI0021C4648C|nr:head decoration protein [Shewanella sp. NFH-SH190041]BDM66232.1 hypothetical protein NFHSH190041_36840 [Shewanella sp. NFH-SH190041]